MDEERRKREELMKAVKNKDGKDHYGYPGGEPGGGEPRDPEIRKKRDKVREVNDFQPFLGLLKNRLDRWL